MSNNYSNTALIILTILISTIFSEANAKSWLDTGNMKLRHELQLLSDTNHLNVPLTTWPLSSEDIQSQLDQSASQKSPELKSTLSSVNDQLSEIHFKVSGNFHSKELLIRDFSGSGREKGVISYDKEWSYSKVDVRLKASLADKSNHLSDKSFRLDESYVAASLGNWKLTAGQQSRWWGPGWDGSLILSNNARPIPSISIENINSKASENEYLRWFGPYKLHMFIGQLESNRAVPNTKLVGTRLTFKPLKTLEVGLHRSIQWGGTGQDNSFSGFLKTLASTRKDSDDNQLTSVRGNQIAGVDFRWNLPLSYQNKYSIYGQYIGEDRVDGSLLLGDETFLLGGSSSGYSKKLQGSWRTYIETADTSAASFKGRARNNIIYNHSTYKDGYRYQGLSMGHSIDSDSTIVSAGAMLAKNNGDFWRAWVKHAELNKDGKGKNTIAPKGKKWTAVGISLDRKYSKKIKLNLGTQFISEKNTGKNRKNNIKISTGFSYSFN